MRWPAKPSEFFSLQHVLARPTLRDASFVGAFIAAFSLVAGAVRTAPLLLAPSVPISLVWPFARAALVVSLEVAFFVAPALGASIAAARLIDRGEARAVYALGASPRSLVAHALPLWIGFALMSFAASFAWGQQAEAPGRLVQTLLEDGRRACENAAQTNPAVPHAASVPLASATWICLPKEPARVVFDLGALGKAAAVARSIELAPNTTSLSADDLQIVVPETTDQPGQTIHVGRATVSGLLPLGRASNLGAFFRGCLLGATACLSAVVTSLVVLVFALGGRALALVVGACGPASALLAFSAFERGPTRLFGYAFVPLFALVAPVVAASVAHLCARRLASR